MNLECINKQKIKSLTKLVTLVIHWRSQTLWLRTNARNDQSGPDREHLSWNSLWLNNIEEYLEEFDFGILKTADRIAGMALKFGLLWLSSARNSMRTTPSMLRQTRQILISLHLTPIPGCKEHPASWRFGIDDWVGRWVRGCSVLHSIGLSIWQRIR